MLICLCRDFMSRQPDRQTIIPQMLDSYGLSKEFFAAGSDTMTASIWRILLDDLGIEFFWKDRQHRFRGASKAFLKGRGVKDVAEILGKTDAELGWLLHTTHAQETEEKVMQTGEPQLDVQEYLSIGHRIQEIPTACSVARVGSCRFLVLAKAAQDVRLQQAILNLTQKIHAIEKVDGNDCTLFLHHAQAHGSEVRSIDSLLQLLVKRLHRAEEKLYGVTLYSNDNLIFPRELFDKIEFGVSITDPETHDVLYLNKAQRDELGMLPDTPLTGKKCYSLMAGNNAPCEDCYLDKLDHTSCITDIFHSQVLNADRLLCHTLVPWNGKSRHFCMSINLDRYLQRHAAHEKVLYQELSVNDIIRAGMYELDAENGIRKMMHRLGSLLDADHVLIAEEDETLLRFSYFWEARTAQPISRTIKPFPREDIRLIYEQFAKAPVFTIDDVEQFCHESGYAPRLPNLQRLIFARLRLDDHIYGYIEVVNPAPEQMEKAVPLLRALARFFSILLRNRNLMQRIDRLSKVAPLTGVMNRRGLLDSLKDLPSGMYAFFFGDLNGLKETNDKLGHDAGDRLIQSAASVFVHSCPTNAVFRMGGDEFLMIQAVQDEQEASAINDRLHDRFRTAGISISLGFSMAALPAINIDAVLAEADCHMYKEKVEHHKTRHQHQATDA